MGETCGKTFTMYLEKRRRKWYAIHEIPESVRSAFEGRKRFCKSLGTEIKAEAQRRAGILEARWRGEIERARSQSGDALAPDANYWRRLRETATSDHEREIIDEQIVAAAEQIVYVAAARAGIDDDHDPDFQQLPEHGQAKRFADVAFGRLVRTDERLDEWLATKTDLKPRQRSMYRSDLQRLSRRFAYLQDVTRPELITWVNKELMGSGGLSRKTVQRVLAPCRGYWSYLQDYGLVSGDADPFRALVKNGKGGGGGRHGRWLPFTTADVVALLSAAEERKDGTLADLIRLGMWTGCRIEELCSLTAGQVHVDHFEVVDAKTPAGRRKVPIHSKLAPTLSKLKAKATAKGADCYILPGLRATKHGERSAAIGKRFGRLKDDLGHSKRHVFHSIRKTVTTELENAGITENVTADILGHHKPSMTYGVYSGGSRLEVLREAIEKLSYPT